MKYIHEQKDWPGFRWNQEAIAERLEAASHRQGRLIGRMDGLGFQLRGEAELRTLTEEVVKSGEIEGEILEIEQVRSSFARRLGIDIGALTPVDRGVEGVVEMTLDATQNFDAPLIRERLFDWHAALFPTGRSGLRRIRTASWRDDRSGPMQVVSGPVGKERLHYEAPAADRVDYEIGAFLEWFNSPESSGTLLKAAQAHLWFVTIHPFDDGNGRIARAITDMVLARSEKNSRRFYSMSSQIRAERKTYYQILEATQKGDLDITSWLQWFLDCLERAFERSERTLVAILRKAKFWEIHGQDPISDRQRNILNRLLDGIEGNLTSSKWAKFAKCSQDTASRDISDLLKRGILQKNPAGGRSTSYSLAEF